MSIFFPNLSTQSYSSLRHENHSSEVVKSERNLQAVVDRTIKSAGQKIVRFPEDKKLVFYLPDLIRDENEVWSTFSKKCPYFPEIKSKQEAEELLDRFSNSPSISYFCSPASLKNPGLELTDIYERIMFSYFPEELVHSLSRYVIKKVGEDHLFAESIASDLKIDSNALDLQDQILNLYLNSPSFLECIRKSIPLEVIANHRIALDIVKCVNVLLPQHQILTFEPENIENELRLRKDELLKINEWIIPEEFIDRLPPLLGCYLENLKEVDFRNIEGLEIVDDFIFSDLLKLPNLQSLTFYSTNIQLEKIDILQLTKQSRSLKKIEILPLEFPFEKLRDWIDYCKEQKIEIRAVGFSNEEKDLSTLLLAIGIEPPLSSSNDSDIFLRETISILSERREELEKITVLNVSNTEILQINPKILNAFLPNLSQIHWGSETSSEEKKEYSYELLKNILDIESLKKLSLYGFRFTSTNIQQLTDLIQSSSSQLEILSLKLDVELRNSKVVELLKEVCYSKGIRLEIAIGNEESDLIRILNYVGGRKFPLNYDFYTRFSALLDKEKMVSFLSQVTVLDLSKCPIFSFPEKLISLFCNVRSISYNYKINIKKDSLLQIIKSFLKFPSLECLNLENNNLNIKDLEHIFKEIQEAKKLKMINLRGNIQLTHSDSNELLDSEEAFAYENFVKLCRDKKIIVDRDIKRGSYIDHYKKAFDFLGLPITSTFLGYLELEEICTNLSEEQKKQLESIRMLDFSRAEFEFFPKKIVPYLSGVKKVSLISRYTGEPKQKTHLLASLLNLPSLEDLDISKNTITKTMMANLILLLESPECKLKKITAISCSWNKEDEKRLQTLCQQKDVDLQLFTPICTEDENDIKTILDKLNENLPINCSITIPQTFQSAQQCMELMSERTRQALENLEQINLSNLNIEYFPLDLLPYLKHVRNIDFSIGEDFDELNHFPDRSEAILPLLQLPNLVILNLSGHKSLSKIVSFKETVLKIPNLRTLIVYDTDIKNDNCNTEFLNQIRRTNIRLECD